MTAFIKYNVAFCICFGVHLSKFDVVFQRWTPCLSSKGLQVPFAFCVTLCEPFPSLSGQPPGIREVIRELHFDVNVWYPAVGRPHVKGQEAVSAGLAAC